MKKSPDVMTAVRKHPLATVFVFVFAALAPLMALRDFTPANELRYLNIADEAIADGSLFAFTNQGEPYADKPPLYFWIVMLCRMLFGKHSMFVLSLFSLLPSFVITYVLDRWLTAQRPGRLAAGDRFAAALMMQTTGLFLGMSVFLRMDMLMCMFIVLALWEFYKSYTGTGNVRAASWLYPAYTFLALFTKGPVGLLLPLVAPVVFLASERKLKTAGKYLGWKTWGVLGGLCLIWFTGVWIDGGKEYLDNLLFHQTIDRAVDSFHHKEPFWYYIVNVWWITAPYCLLLVPGLGVSLSSPHERSAAEKLFAVTAASAFVMLSCFSSKLAIYLAPALPFMVYGWVALSMRKDEWRWASVALAVPCVLWITAGTAIIAALAFSEMPMAAQLFERYPFASSPTLYVAAGLLFAGGVVSLVMLRRKKAWNRPVTALASSLLLAVLTVSPVIPQANPWLGYRELCRMIPEGEEVYTLYVFRPENMDVYLGRDITDYGKDAAAFLENAPEDGVLVVAAARVAELQELSAFLDGKPYVRCGDYAICSL